MRTGNDDSGPPSAFQRRRLTSNSQNCSPMDSSACTANTASVYGEIESKCAESKQEEDLTASGSLICSDLPAGVSVVAATAKLLGHWEEVLDPAVGVPYYVNTETGESRWEVPGGFGQFEPSMKPKDAREWLFRLFQAQSTECHVLLHFFLNY